MTSDKSGNPKSRGHVPQCIIAGDSNDHYTLMSIFAKYRSEPKDHGRQSRHHEFDSGGQVLCSPVDRAMFSCTKSTLQPDLLRGTGEWGQNFELSCSSSPSDLSLVWVHYI